MLRIAPEEIDVARRRPARLSLEEDAFAGQIAGGVGHGVGRLDNHHCRAAWAT
jgi:hypothetical protein